MQEQKSENRDFNWKLKLLWLNFKKKRRKIIDFTFFDFINIIIIWHRLNNQTIKKNNNNNKLQKPKAKFLDFFSYIFIYMAKR